MKSRFFKAVVFIAVLFVQGSAWAATEENCDNTILETKKGKWLDTTKEKRLYTCDSHYVGRNIKIKTSRLAEPYAGVSVTIPGDPPEVWRTMVDQDEVAKLVKGEKITLLLNDETTCSIRGNTNPVLVLVWQGKGGGYLVGSGGADSIDCQP